MTYSASNDPRALRSFLDFLILSESFFCSDSSSGDSDRAFLLLEVLTGMDCAELDEDNVLSLGIEIVVKI